MNRSCVILLIGYTALSGSASFAQKLENLTHVEVKKQEFRVAIFPIGSCEPHGYHLPYGTDFFTVDVLAAKTADKANQQGAKVLVLPTMPCGVNSNLASIPHAQSIRPATVMQFVRDVVDTAQKQGIRKVVIFNGHGGNRATLGAAQRELFDSHRQVFVTIVELYSYADQIPKGTFSPSGMGHGGEAETSVGLAFFPDKVHMDKAVVPRMGTVKLQTMDSHFTWITPWEQHSNTTAADPTGATAGKGQKLVDVFVERVSRFLVELSNAEITPTFPY